MSALFPTANKSDIASGLETSGSIPIDDQLRMATRLRDIYITTVDSGNAVLPLPVRLFVEAGKRCIAQSGAVESLPRSIPEIYSTFLELVNPDNPSVQNFLSQPDMLRAAMTLAKLALTPDYIPSAFDEADAVSELKSAGFNFQNVDPVKRLIENGVLASKGFSLSRRLRFVLDPLAEHLAATLAIREVKGDAERLEAIRAQAAGAGGFLRALQLAINERIEGARKRKAEAT